MKEYTGCNNCKYDSKESNEFPCVECSHNRAIDYYEPKTNADRIRNMSDEELAKLLQEAEDCGYRDASITPITDDGYMDMLEWLQAEVKESDSDAS